MRKGIAVLMTTLLAASLSVSAQGPGQGQRPNQGSGDKQEESRVDQFLRGIPNITPEQTSKVKELHLQFMKGANGLHTRIGEKEAHLQTLATDDKPDMKAIDLTIDEIHALKGQLAKLRMKLRMDIRQLLTPDQRIVFDRRMIAMEKGGGRSSGAERSGDRGPARGPQGRPQGGGRP